MLEHSHVTIQTQGSVRIIRMEDERRLNALSHRMRLDLAAGIQSAVQDPEVRAIYITGSGRAFCSGGDLKILHEEGGAWTSHQRLTHTNRWFIDLVRLPKPVVIGVNGLAVGGAVAIAAAGDVVYAAQQNASFRAGFLQLGLIPDMGMTYLLPRLVGLGRAKDFIYGQASWSAQKAADLGLITAAVPDEELETRCMERARELAAGPIEGLGLTKQLLARSFENSLEEMTLLENLGQSVAHTTAAAQEGVSAALHRRSPDFPSATSREWAP